jgi:hypothetical protein
MSFIANQWRNRFITRLLALLTRACVGAGCLR